MISDNLSGVNLLIHKRFASFMELPNMAIEQAEQSRLYRDLAYDILLVHELPRDISGVHDLQYFSYFKN